MNWVKVGMKYVNLDHAVAATVNGDGSAHVYLVDGIEGKVSLGMIPAQTAKPIVDALEKAVSQQP